MKGRVEIVIGGHGGGAAHSPDERTQMVDLFGGGGPRGLAAGRPFQHQPGLDQIILGERRQLQMNSQHHAHTGGGVLHDRRTGRRTRSRCGLQDSDRLEYAKGLPNRELTFGRQLITRFECAHVEAMLDLGDHLLVRSDARDRLPLGWRRLRHCAPSACVAGIQ